MRLVIVGHGETEWTLATRHTGSTDVDLADHGRAEAAALPSLLQRVLGGERATLFSSPRRCATATAVPAFAGRRFTVEQLVAEYDYGDCEDTFLQAPIENNTRSVVVVTHGYFSRILAARAMAVAPENERSFASATAAVSLIKDYHGERYIGLWNVDPALLTDVATCASHPDSA